jgi:hypothetical protein
LKASPSFLSDPEDCVFFNFWFTFLSHEYWGVDGHHPQRPILVEGIYTTGCYLVPRDRSRNWQLTTPVPRSPRHDASHLGLGGSVILKAPNYNNFGHY